uniref:cellulase n=1 Tax=uncultured symbiotic protist of Reticulitermes speratus TaxID=403658 RepID=A4UWN5_9EUKA|nr:putative glycosyl hydrolase family7 [uncultured symbiotic protist of Reticulitermes speratus]
MFAVAAAFYLFVSLFAVDDYPILSWERNGKTIQGRIVVDLNWRGENHTNEIDYKNIGVWTEGNALNQRLVTVNPWGNTVGQRLYLLAEEGDNYELLDLVGSELTYDVDISQIPCGLNAALYTVEMAPGGAKAPEVGAAYGSGYCDAQFLGADDLGCGEFDIWEANRAATVYTTHACTQTGQFAKGSATCDSNGCGYNSYRDSNEHNFYGNASSFTVDSSKPFTVITQFLSSGGALTSVVRKYIQNGRTITSTGALDGNRCTSSQYSLAQMGKSLSNGHVLAFSLWDSSNGLDWLDAGNNGPCSGQDESATYLEKNFPDATITWSNIRFGPIDSTY